MALPTRCAAKSIGIMAPSHPRVPHDPPSVLESVRGRSPSTSRAVGLAGTYLWGIRRDSVIALCYVAGASCAGQRAPRRYRENTGLHPDRTQLLVDLGASRLSFSFLSVREGLTYVPADSDAVSAAAMDDRFFKVFAADFTKKTRIALPVCLPPTSARRYAHHHILAPPLPTLVSHLSTHATPQTERPISHESNDASNPVAQEMEISPAPAELYQGGSMAGRKAGELCEDLGSAQVPPALPAAPRMSSTRGHSWRKSIFVFLVLRQTPAD
ncbi:hypothetical protein HYPSUDRAFT_207915 [Hypholoma sublateritium FD-334 SS-4]|uniref:Uncharacterized protein n=1 Tax=Hypholoma sublateritium (strain FD-334 SS-4) TaxID=945553 RepID=A0A0D2NFB4_HYPSF|nr:hypothetical protein HYPSUDRAFT_207915 [Hypholoma sublateritium FD-334 SS-4]